MRSAFRSTWNDLVTEGDEVYDLGDTCLGTIPEDVAKKWLSSLNGTKRLALGNHDTSFVGPEFYSAIGFADIAEVYSAGDGLFLGHFPVYTIDDLFSPEFLDRSHPVRRARFFADWNEMLKEAGCSRLIHGHTHAQGPERPGHFNCCVDRNGWSPVRLEDASGRISGEILWGEALTHEHVAEFEKEIGRMRS